MKKIFLAICIAVLSITDIIAQNVTVDDAKDLIIGTWYRDFSTYSEPQNIVPIDTSFKIVYDQNNIYYYEDNVLVDQCWYEIRNTDCNNISYINTSYLVELDPVTDEVICTLFLNITNNDLVLTNDSGKIYHYVKTP